jgi:hypothetical protein
MSSIWQSFFLVLIGPCAWEEGGQQFWTHDCWRWPHHASVVVMGCGGNWELFLCFVSGRCSLLVLRGAKNNAGNWPQSGTLSNRMWVTTSQVSERRLPDPLVLECGTFRSLSRVASTILHSVALLVGLCLLLHWAKSDCDAVAICGDLWGPRDGNVQGFWPLRAVQIQYWSPFLGWLLAVAPGVPWEIKLFFFPKPDYCTDFRPFIYLGCKSERAATLPNS